MNAKNPKYVNPDHSTIDLTIEHPKLGWIPYTAHANDSEALGRDLYARAVTGEFGEITPYQPPSEEQVLAEQTRKMRGERDRRLAQLDTVVSNPLRWAGYTADQQAALATYRQALLDVPQQEGFPVEIDWPVMPDT